MKALATGNALPRAKVKALWVLDGNDSIDVATLTTALADPSRDVRMNAVRIAERWLGDVNHPIHAAVLKLIDDPDWNVRRAARRVARRDGDRAEGNGSGVAPAETRERSGRDGRGVERHARHRNGGARDSCFRRARRNRQPPKPRSR